MSSDVPVAIDRYRVAGRLGAGGAGAVFAATADDGRALALKLMLPQWADNAVMVARFQREIDTLSQLRDPRVVRILDHGRLPDGRLWYVMPRLEGRDLHALLVERGRLSVDDALVVMDAVCAALSAAHAAGVIHRDLKASNVFVGTEQPPSITLLDFGAARVDTSQQGKGLTVAGTVVGTPTSMAPEQIVGFDPDERTDVYAAGILLFLMLTGRYPFEGESSEQVMLDQLSTPPPRPSELAAVPVAVERIVMRCLEKRPEDRFPTADALRDAVREASGTAPAAAPVQTRAIALHLELLAPEAIADTWGLDALELAAARLVDAGFELALGIGGSVLGVMPANDAGALAATHALATGLLDELAHDVHPALEPRVIIHVADATSSGSTGLELRLDELDAWADTDLPAGVHLSSAARALA
jgi:eukaryotic-like serine/threonine-protein kinase